jgi:hypothetical protein
VRKFDIIDNFRIERQVINGQVRSENVRVICWHLWVSSLGRHPAITLVGPIASVGELLEVLQRCSYCPEAYRSSRQN